MVVKNSNTIILSTKDGMVALDSPVKLKILKFIGNNSRSFEEIVMATCKAKSTVSVHLQDLLKQNLIVEQRDKADRRKKFFTINSHLIAYSQTPVQKNYDVIIDKLIESVDMEYEFFKTLCHTVRYGMEAYGVNPGPIMKKIGNDIGKKVASLFTSDSLEDLLAEMASFWKKQELGTIETSGFEPLTILVYDCFDCSDMPDVGRTLCSLDEGLMEGILEGCLNLMTIVEEVECYGTGYNHCKFKVHVLD